MHRLQVSDAVEFPLSQKQQIELTISMSSGIRDMGVDSNGDKTLDRIFNPLTSRIKMDDIKWSTSSSLIWLIGISSDK